LCLSVGVTGSAVEVVTASDVGLLVGFEVVISSVGLPVVLVAGFKVGLPDGFEVVDFSVGRPVGMIDLGGFIVGSFVGRVSGDGSDGIDIEENIIPIISYSSSHDPFSLFFPFL